MAVAWPDFGAATAAGREFLDAIFGAIEERAAVARAAGTNVAFERPLAPCAAPTHGALLAVQRAVLALAPAFVRLGEEEDAWNKFADFPRHWSAEAVASGGHSVARLPLPGAPEGHPESLALVRAFLANCAWWLDRFRAVDASPFSWYTRLLTASATRSNGVGAAPIASFATPTIRESARRADRTPDALEIKLSESRYRRDRFDNGAWETDWDVWSSESAEGTFRCGLSVPNRAGIRARCLLFPVFSGSRRKPKKTETDNWVDSRIDKWPDDPDGDFLPGRWTGRDRHLEWDDGWRETFAADTSGEQSLVPGPWAGSYDFVGTETRTTRTTAWSDDGLRSLVLDERTETEAARATNMAESHATDVDDFDGCGLWTCGTPVDAGVAAAYGRVLALDRFDAIPVPAGADLTAMRRMRDEHPLDLNDEEIVLHVGIRFVPILDYHEFFTHHYAQ